MLQFDNYLSPAGMLRLTGRNGVLTGLTFEKGVPQKGVQAAPVEFELAKRWLDDYFKGLPRDIDFPMATEGRPCQKLIWWMLLEMCFGKICTYGELAKSAAAAMGKERMSAQAVGQAVGRNPIAIIIPCHRVVGAGGKLTGYAYGLERKQWLLTHEQK